MESGLVIIAKHFESRFLPNIRSDELTDLDSNVYEHIIPLVTPEKVTEEIRTCLNPRKVPGFDMTTSTIFKEIYNKVNWANLCFNSVEAYTSLVEGFKTNHANKTSKSLLCDLFRQQKSLIEYVTTDGYIN